LQTYFGPIHMLIMDSNTLCTTDKEQWKLVTIVMACVVATSFFVVDNEMLFLKNI